MKITYNNILNTMKQAYFDITGERVYENSDLSARFQAVASELFSLGVYGDFILRQAFVQSAEAEYLDSHAALRGISRKHASKATGSLTFYVDEPKENDAQIPAGTICSSSENAYLQFETTENAVLPVGDTSVTVSAAALENGADYNVQAGEVSVMVTPPSGINGVINEEAFSSGYDEESDEALRERIVNSYRADKTGMSLDSIEEQLKKIDDVLDAGVFLGENKTLNVYIKTGSSQASQELISEIENSIPLAGMLGFTVNVSECETVNYDLSLDITAESSVLEKVKNEAVSALSYLKNATGIGERIELYKIAYSLRDIEGLKYCDIASESAQGGIINCESSQALKLNNIRVSCHE